MFGFQPEKHQKAFSVGICPVDPGLLGKLVSSLPHTLLAASQQGREDGEKAE